MLVLALVAALVLTVRIEEWRLAAQRRRAAAVIVAESNRSAERDTTRDVATENARVAKLLGDSLRLVEKQVVQVAQKRDALDRALGRERVARYAATAVVDSLERVVAAADSVVRDASREVRVARFDVRQEPYTIVADVELPPPPDSATMRVKVAVDPIPIEARVTCAELGGIERGRNLGANAGVGERTARDRVSVARGVCAVADSECRTAFVVARDSAAGPRCGASVGHGWARAVGGIRRSGSRALAWSLTGARRQQRQLARYPARFRRITRGVRRTALVSDCQCVTCRRCLPGIGILSNILCSFSQHNVPV